MNNKERAKFRTTKIWKEHREYIKKLQNGKDAITEKPLRKGFICHHLCSDRDRYAELSDELQIDLNSQSHKFLHIFYTWMCKNPQAVDNLIRIAKKMYELNNGQDFE